MPVYIYKYSSDDLKIERIAWLCDGEWELSPQIDALTKWLEFTGATLRPDAYVADIGFGWRRDAASGGPVLEPNILRRMADLGMSLHLSEYAGFTDEFED